MSGRVLIIRPQPGADETAVKVRALGMEPLVRPFFAVAPVAWTPPDPNQFDAVMLTSANALRHGGHDLARYGRLPAWCVGEKTAQAARQAGFAEVHVAGPDGAALVAAMERAGLASALHLAGRDVRLLPETGLRITRIAVYANVAQPVDLASLGEIDVVLVHSPRAGQALEALIPAAMRSRIVLVAISAQALAAAGTGWRAAAVAASPDEGAMLALATQMCH